jgi:flagellar hook-associated protein 1 FlgK
MAKEVADRINSLLAAGYPPPSEPYHLFVYGASAISIAHTIRVNPTLAPALLNATDPLADPPLVNGKALQLANLAQPIAPEDMIDGLSYVSFFGKLSADAGRNVAAAKQEVDARSQLTAQARNMRTQVSGVSFDEEAIELVQLQRAYQATAQMIRTVDELLDVVMSIGR